MAGPILFCYDGSDGSRQAMRIAVGLVSHPYRGFVLTVWEPVYARLAVAGSLAMLPLTDEEEVDLREARYATALAEEGVLHGAAIGFDLRSLVRQAQTNVAQAVLQAADEFDAALIVCGQHGRGPVRTALFGSVSHALSSRARRPVLIVPEAAKL